MNIVVTGGLGFLGSHLTRMLAEQGHAVLVIDPAKQVDSAFRLGLSASLVEDVTSLRVGLGIGPAPGHVQVARMQTRQYWMLPGSKEWPVARIYHLGATASPPAYKKRPLRSLKSGSLGTHTATQIANRFGARLLLASTSEVYGDPLVNPQPESYRGNVDPVGPRSMYDEAKRYAEAWVAAHIRSGHDYRIARIFNTFGPGMSLNDGRMVTEFVKACMEGRPIPVHGDGTQTRTLCYVDDLIAGLIFLMEEPLININGNPMPVNLGGTEEVTVTEVAEVIRACWWQSTRLETPEPAFVTQPCKQDPKRRQPDIRLAGKLLGWKPSTPWKLGIQRTVQWLAQQS